MEAEKNEQTDRQNHTVGHIHKILLERDKKKESREGRQKGRQKGAGGYGVPLGRYSQDVTTVRQTRT